MGYASSDDVRCQFQPRNGRYFDRCRELATWRKIGEDPKPGVERQPFRYAAPTTNIWDPRERRCDRHKATDIRTATNRDWDTTIPVFEPFDAKARLAEIAEKARTDAEREAEIANLENASAAVALIEHTITLAKDERDVLFTIAGKVERRLDALKGETA